MSCHHGLALRREKCQNTRALSYIGCMHIAACLARRTTQAKLAILGNVLPLYDHADPVKGSVIWQMPVHMACNQPSALSLSSGNARICSPSLTKMSSVHGVMCCMVSSVGLSV